MRAITNTTTQDQIHSNTPGVNADVYCTSEDLCRRLSVTRTTIWRWQRERGFPAGKKLGLRMVRFRVAEVDAWLAMQA